MIIGKMNHRLYDNWENEPRMGIINVYIFYNFNLDAGNAEMTELFRCRKSGTQCCAPKSMIRELQEQKNGIAAQSRNETVPAHYRPLHSSPHIAGNTMRHCSDYETSLFTLISL